MKCVGDLYIYISLGELDSGATCWENSEDVSYQMTTLKSV